MTRVAIVTGAGSGIGRATALALAADGWQLFLAGRRLARLEAVAVECGAHAVPIACDVTERADRDALVAAAVEALAGAEVAALVQCAGSAVFGPLAEVSEDAMLGQLAVNFTGPAALCRAVLPSLLASGQGRIVNVLSVAAVLAFPGAAAYGGAKAGLLAFGRSLALEVRGSGVQVTAILPGATDTPLWVAGSGPPREQMLSAEAVAEAIRDVLRLPADRNVDELTLMPPRGIL